MDLVSPSTEVFTQCRQLLTDPLQFQALLMEGEHQRLAVLMQGLGDSQGQRLRVGGPFHLDDIEHLVSGVNRLQRHTVLWPVGTLDQLGRNAASANPAAQRLLMHTQLGGSLSA